MSRGRDIEVLKLAQRIAVELESGRVDEVDMDDKTVGRIAAMLAPRMPAVRRSPAVLRPRPSGDENVQLTA